MNGKSSLYPSFTERVNEIVNANLANEHFGVKELARELGMSRFIINQKLHLVCGKTINRYIREFRLHRAKELLEQDMHNASEVAYMVGFGSPAYFSTCFSEFFGFPPGEIKKRGMNGYGQHQEDAPQPLENSDRSVRDAGTRKPGQLKQAWKIAFQVTFFVLFSLVFIQFLSPGIFANLNVLSWNKSKVPERSIAVLPFRNDSQDPGNEYFINGVMEAILDNLIRIKDLEVHPRTSVEQFRNNSNLTIPQIARELGVNYIIEGSGQKVGDQAILYIQLIEARSDKHLFSHCYNLKLENIFNIQSDVAISVASEIQAVITTEERASIQKIPTRNFAAVSLCLQANDLHNIAESGNKWELDLKAENLYRRAIRLDSAYADPYAQLGWIVSGRDIDSAMYFAGKALYLDPGNSVAHNLKGLIYWAKGMEQEAENSFNLSVKCKPNNSDAYRGLGDLYFFKGNCSRAIEYQLMAFHQENNSYQQRKNVESFASNLYSLGFYDEGAKYATRLLELNNDSTYYYWGLVTADLDRGNYQSALGYANKMYNFDPENPENIYRLFYTNLYLRDFRAAELLLNKYIAIMERQGRKIEPDYLLGFALLEAGRKAEADYHLDGVIGEMNKIITSDPSRVNSRVYLTLVKIYSARNDRPRALEYLHKVRECMGTTVLRVKDYRNCTMLDNIRSEPEFALYLNEADGRYREEHDKVAGILIKEGILIAATQ